MHRCVNMKKSLSLWSSISSHMKSGGWTKAGWPMELPGALYLEELSGGKDSVID